MYANDKPFHKTILIREYQGVEVKPHIEMYISKINSFAPFHTCFKYVNVSIYIFITQEKVPSKSRSLYTEVTVFFETW